jgi:hypothetical protein
MKVFLTCFVLVGSRQIDTYSPRSSWQDCNQSGQSPITPSTGTSETQNEKKERLKKSQKFEYENNVGYSDLLSSVLDEISFWIVDS